MINDSKLALVLPGGGLAGTYTIEILYQLSQSIMKRFGNGKTIYDFVDIFFGTSTGGIIGASLLIGMPLEQIRNLYLEGDKYFIPDCPWWKPSFLHMPKYKRDPILNVILKYSKHPNMKMSEIYETTGKHLMLSTVNKNWIKCKNEFIKSWNDNYKDEYVTNAIAKTFAASYYFGNINDNKYQIVYGDGGEGDSNNPVIEAYASICNNYPDDKIKMLNIGTGFYNKDVGYKKAVKSGNIKDAVKVIGMARSQATTTAIYAAERIEKRDHNFSFLNIDSMYPNADMDALDGLKWVKTYQELAQEEYKKQEATILNFLFL
jgi:patatin-like phospholipase/acyl hydrolase